MLTDRSRGSVVFLFPAGIVVVLVLAALAVDIGHVRLRGQEPEAAASSAANDALGALDVETLRSRGTLAIDPAAARRIAAETVAAGPMPDASLVSVDIAADAAGNATSIAVTLRATIELVFAPALGDLDTVTFERTGRAIILG